MAEIQQRQERLEFGAEITSLWRIAAGPLIWAVHFLISYSATAIWCAKVATGDGILVFRMTIGGMTLAALVAIAWLGWRSWRQWDVLRDRDYEDKLATGEDRHQFLGHAAFLLSIIAFVAVIYVSLPAIFIRSCV